MRVGDDVRIRGSIEGVPPGTVLTPRVRSGRGEWRDAVGEVIVGERGTFTWNRAAPRRGQLRVMFVVGDFRSNIIIIRAGAGR